MRKSFALAAVAAAALSIAAAACTATTPTDPRDPAAAARHDGGANDTTKKCGGMIGSGTATC
jgi:hypothetical protein